MRRRILVVMTGVVLTLGMVSPALASPQPPTNGGNGAGHSGQCTGSPADRPAVCPGT
jgi:hypothetical protein